MNKLFFDQIKYYFYNGYKEKYIIIPCNIFSNCLRPVMEEATGIRAVTYHFKLNWMYCTFITDLCWLVRC